MSHRGNGAASYDAIVVGAGHNGLTCAAMLGRAGRRVLVLERSSFVGGMAASEEFHPGYRSAGLLHDTTGVRPEVARALDLQRHGLKLRGERAPVLALGDDGRGLLLHGDAGKAAAEISQHSSRDSERYLPYRAFLDRLRGALGSFLDEPPVNLVDLESEGAWGLIKRALRVRRLGGAEMMELLRLPPMCAGDWLDEWFETDLLKAALCLPAIAGGWMGPRSPMSNASLLLWESAAGPGVVGGGPALVAALKKSARSAGVEIRTRAQVQRVLTDAGAAQGVVVDGSEEIQAPVVAASCDPKSLFLRLLPAGAIASKLEQRIRAYRARGTTAQVLLALDAPLRFTCRGNQGGVEQARTGSRLSDLERAFDAIKYRRFSESPILDIHIPTVASPDLAPEGHSVVSILVHFAPYDLEPEWNDSQRHALGDRVIEILARHTAGLRPSIVSGMVLSPADLEARYGAWGGQIHHGEQTLDQMLVRPAPECYGYATPIKGLYLCGSGSHPGGGLTCLPGKLAAETILRGSRRR